MLFVKAVEARSFSHDRPSAPKVELVDTKLFLTIGVANASIDVVIVDHWTE